MRAARSTSLFCASLALLATAALAPAAADDTSNSKARGTPRCGVRSELNAPPGAYAEPPPWQSPRRPVERGELGPVLASDGSGLPLELWQGLDLSALEGLLAGLELPPRAFALERLWRRMLRATANAPRGVPDAAHFMALRLEALYRSGLLQDMAELLGSSDAAGPVVETLAARRDIGLGRREAGCERVHRLASPRSGLPGRLKGETQLLVGYCAAATGDTAGAGLAVELAREEGFEAALPLTVLASVAAATKPRLELPRRVLLLDYRFLELLGPVDAMQVLDRAEPALLVALAADQRTDARVAAAASEAALRLHAAPPDTLAAAYRHLAHVGGKTLDPSAQQGDALLRRALFFRAVELARSPAERARFMRALLDDGRNTAMRPSLARLIAPELAALEPARELAWFAETAIEIALSGDDFDRARAWASRLPHWLDLIEVVNPRGPDPAPRLGAIEELAVHGRLGAEALHRLVTVLEALDIDVPIALWDAASRTPQPAAGYLPDTGVLAELAAAAKRGEVGHAILGVMRALGPYGPEGAHVLALRDGVRALKRVGLAADARRLALEALLPVWPRLAVN
jgi:hypothetical protein